MHEGQTEFHLDIDNRKTQHFQQIRDTDEQIIVHLEYKQHFVKKNGESTLVPQVNVKYTERVTRLSKVQPYLSYRLELSPVELVTEVKATSVTIPGQYEQTPGFIQFCIVVGAIGGLFLMLFAIINLAVTFTQKLDFLAYQAHDYVWLKENSDKKSEVCF